MTEAEPIFVHRYRLRSRQGSLNALARRREYEGILIRHGGGHACIHPWPELGDPSLESCLVDLSGPRRRAIVRRALRCAEMDRVAREFGHSLFEDLEVPASHASVPDAAENAIASAAEAGFGTVKIKAGRDAGGEARRLCELAARFPALRWRIDANEQFEPADAARYLAALDDSTLRALDFIEDPCPYAEATWCQLGQGKHVRLAVDREASPLTRAAQVMIIKPAIDEPLLLAESAMRNSQHVVVTSYMDHPVGQAFAAWEAARLALGMPGLVGLCGVQTHHLFEPDAFSEMLGPWSPSFTIPEGHGIGFDDLFDMIPWTRI